MSASARRTAAPTAPLAYPACPTAALFDGPSHAAMAALCTPYSQAADGDILGIVTEVEFRSTVAHYLPLFRFLVKTGDGTGTISFRDLPESLQGPAAMAIAQFQAHPQGARVFEAPCDELCDPGDDLFRADALIAPGAALLCEDRAAEFIEDLGESSDAIEQSDLDSVMKLLIPTADSTHSALATQAALRDAADLFNAHLRLADASGEDIDLAPPRFP